MRTLGAVPYLNARPLLEGLAGDPDLRLSLEPPARLAGSLRAGELDAALVPAAVLASGGPWRAVDAVAIGSDGPVRSVLLHLRRPPGQVRTLAPDPESLTSNALARIVLREAHGQEPVEAAPEEADAVLAIGDRALRGLPGPWPEVLDLGEAWKRLTGLPFVFALWIGRSALDRPLAERLRRAAREGAARAYPDEGARFGLGAEATRRYLGTEVRYALGERERSGLEAFLTRLGGEAPQWI